MTSGFCRTGYDLLLEVAQTPSENIPPFNVCRTRSVGWFECVSLLTALCDDHFLFLCLFTLSKLGSTKCM